MSVFHYDQSPTLYFITTNPQPTSPQSIMIPFVQSLLTLQSADGSWFKRHRNRVELYWGWDKQDTQQCQRTQDNLRNVWNVTPQDVKQQLVRSSHWYVCLFLRELADSLTFQISVNFSPENYYSDRTVIAKAFTNLAGGTMALVFMTGCSYWSWIV